MGYPTRIMADCDLEKAFPKAKTGKNDWTLTLPVKMDLTHYEGELYRHSKDLSIHLDSKTLRPYVVLFGQRYDSTNQLLTSDNWANNSTGTSGDSWPTKVQEWQLTLTVKGSQLYILRNGFIDQTLPLKKKLKAPKK